MAHTAVSQWAVPPLGRLRTQRDPHEILGAAGFRD